MRYCVCLSVCVSFFDPCASMCVNALRLQWPPDSDTSSAHYQPLPLRPSLFPSCDTCLRLFTDMSQRTCNILHSILSRVSLYLPCALCIFYLQRERQRARGREGGSEKVREWGEWGNKHSVFSSVMFERWLSTDRSTSNRSCRSSPWFYDDDDIRIYLG